MVTLGTLLRRHIQGREFFLQRLPKGSGASNEFSAWFKKCHVQVTPEIDRALMVKGTSNLDVTLI
jgi:hypothetical protein